MNRSRQGSASNIEISKFDFADTCETCPGSDWPEVSADLSEDVPAEGPLRQEDVRHVPVRINWEAQQRVRQIS